MRREWKRHNGKNRLLLVIMLTTVLVVVSIVFIMLFLNWGGKSDDEQSTVTLIPEPIPEDDVSYGQQSPEMVEEDTPIMQTEVEEAGEDGGENALVVSEEMESPEAEEKEEPESPEAEETEAPESPKVVELAEIEPTETEETEVAVATELPGSEKEASTEDENEEREVTIHSEKVDICLPGLHRSYTLAWVSDLHLISEEDLSRKGEDVRPGYKAELRIRRKTFSVTDDGICAEDVWPQIVEYLNSRYFDGILFGGDMIDYCSHPNISLISEGYDQLKCRNQMYLRADHDYGAWYGEDVFTQDMADTLHHNLDGENRYDPKVMDFTGFRIIGVNYSNKDLLPDEAGKLIELEQCGKPVLVATHVPIASLQDASLAQLSMQVRNQIYYWDESQTSGNYVPNSYTSSFMDSIYTADTPVHYVLAGHLHAQWEGKLTDTVPEHIFSPAFSGVVGIIRIHPDDWDPAHPYDYKRFQKNRLKDR